MTHTRFINGLSDIIDEFDLFLLDQFGVLHFGRTAPASTIKALRYLQEQGKNVIVLSNSSKDVAYSADRMTQLSITPDMYDLLITSGEIVRMGIQKREAPPFRDLGTSCMLIAREGDTQGFDDIGLNLVTDPVRADFVIMTNCDYKTRPLESYYPVMDECRARDLLMICANPDKHVVEGTDTYYGPGQIVDYYERIGGRVYYIGKPDPHVFEYAVARAKKPVPPERTIMIGDSMGHDIIGAVRMGFAACLTKTGIPAQIFADMGDAGAVQKLAEEYGVAPTIVIPEFSV